MDDNEKKRADHNDRFDLWKTMEKAQDPTQRLSATEKVESVDFQLSPSDITIFYDEIHISSRSLSEMPSPGETLPQLMMPPLKYRGDKKKKKKSVVSVVGKSKQKKKKVARSTTKHTKPKTV